MNVHFVVCYCFLYLVPYSEVSEIFSDTVEQKEIFSFCWEKIQLNSGMSVLLVIFIDFFDMG